MGPGRKGDYSPKVSTLGMGEAATREAAVARAKMTAPKDFILTDLFCLCGKEKEMYSFVL